MASSRFALIDPAAGIAGDMLLGALIGAGAPEEWLRALPARLGLQDVTVEVRRVRRCGISAVKVDVRVRGEIEQPTQAVIDASAPAAAATWEDHGTVDDDGRSRLHRHAEHGGDEAHGATHAHSREGEQAAGHGHSHGHSHAHGHTHAHSHENVHGHHHAPAHGTPVHDHGHGPHRHVGELIGIVERAPLSTWVKTRAVRALRLIGEAEGRVHGVPADHVMLHEIGAMDAVIDIVGGIEGFEQLGITRIHAGPVTLGNGWVRCAHGIMPVPAPATAILVGGLEIGPDGPVSGEATTPTGAALLRVLAEGAAPPRWRAVSGAAWGAGTRDPGAWPNALRLIVGEAADEAESVVMLAADMDDLSPEYLEPLRGALVQAGALDVQSWTTIGKKGRAGFRVEVQAPPAAVEAVTDAFLRHGSTIGVRRWSAARSTLARTVVTVQTAGGPVRVKVVDAPGGPRAKAEYDDVVEAVRRSGQSAAALAHEAQAEALAGRVLDA